MTLDQKKPSLWWYLLFTASADDPKIDNRKVVSSFSLKLSSTLSLSLSLSLSLTHSLSLFSPFSRMPSSLTMISVTRWLYYYYSIFGHLQE